MNKIFLDINKYGKRFKWRIKQIYELYLYFVVKQRTIYGRRLILTFFDLIVRQTRILPPKRFISPRFVS